MQVANEFLEREYWPEWNERFARPLAAVTDLHRPLPPEIDLAASLSHVEQRVISNGYTFSFAGRRYQIARPEVQAGMRQRNLRVELRLDGTLKARYQGRYVEVAECGAKVPVQPAPPRKPRRKDHNAGGRSQWMEGFWNRPAPPIWQAIRESNARVWTVVQDEFGAPGKPRPAVFALDSPKASAPPRLHQREGGWKGKNNALRGRLPGCLQRACCRCFLRSQPCRRLGLGGPRQARPRRGQPEHSMGGRRDHSKPELSTLLGCGTFYFALTGKSNEGRQAVARSPERTMGRQLFPSDGPRAS
jgi:hypothetical protein